MQKKCTTKDQDPQTIKEKKNYYKGKILNYIKAQNKQSNNRELKSDQILLQYLREQILSMQEYSQEILNVFHCPLWNYLVSAKIIKKIIEKTKKVDSILAVLLMIADGYFNYSSQKISINHIKMPLILKYQGFFVLQAKENYFLLFEVGLHKVYNNQKGNSPTISFDIVQKITFIDLWYCQKAQEIQQSILIYQFEQLKNYYRTEFQVLQCTSQYFIHLIIGQQINEKNKGQQYLFSNQKQNFPEILLCANKQLQFIPLTFTNVTEKKNNMVFERQQWILKSYWQKLERIELQQKSSHKNSFILQQFADFYSVGKIIDLLKNAPFFRLKFSDEERDIIGSNDNSVVIGRSGTGKTTCTILRIFSIETLSKVRSKLFGQKSLTFLKDSQGEKNQLRQIFTTVNKFLIRDVEKYYLWLQGSAQQAAQRYREQSYFDMDETFVSENHSEITNFDGDILDFLTQEIPGGQGSFTFAPYQINVDKIQKLSFPSFLPVFNLIILLDKQMTSPYFSDERISKLKEKHIKSIGFRNADGLNLNQFFSQQVPSSTQNSTIIVPQVEFDMFYLEFWPTVAPRQKQGDDQLALPTLIWTQIYSTIKGSQYSYFFENRYLPFSLYKDKVSSFLAEEQIQLIYSYFQKYELWKESKMYFDQLDLVNNLLHCIEYQLYNIFPIHYSYIDEVQDLPSATIELLCRITEQKVFFCGDTAQSILKGIGFRFQDLTQIFKNSKTIGNSLQNFQMFQLTKNFRSHNNILQFANCLVSLLELLFPKSIDHLKKEISNLKGPKPIIITNPDYNLVLNQLAQDRYSEQQCEIQFGSDQVIIVKNKDAKDELPSIFSEARHLTVFEAKGLEFDDVILYNLFTSDSIGDNQWDLLTCIDVEEISVDSQIYDSNITKFEKSTQNDQEYQDQEGENIKLKKMKVNQKLASKNIYEYSSLCNELKALYVCITRAKKRIIIYDDKPEKRRQLEQILRTMDLCEFVSEIDYLSNNQIKMKYQDFQYENLTESEKEQWEYHGQQMFERKNYEEAEKCFKKSGNLRMYEQAQAYKKATRAAEKKASYKILKNSNNRFFTQNQKGKIEELRKIFQKNFYEAAKIFHQHKDFLQEANCYYSGQYYEQSLLLYLSLSMLHQAAKNAKKLKLYLFAVIILLKIGDIKQSIDLIINFDVDNILLLKLMEVAFNQQLISQEEVEKRLFLLAKQHDSIFNRLYPQKYDYFKNKFGEEKLSVNNICYIKEIQNQFEIHSVFYTEIDFIKQSEIIFVEGDVYQTLFQQIKRFWKQYFNILSNYKIIHNFQFNVLEDQFHNNKFNQVNFFIVSLLELFGYYQIIYNFIQGYEQLYKLQNHEKYQGEIILNYKTLDYQFFTNKELICHIFFFNSSQLKSFINARNQNFNELENIFDHQSNFQHYFVEKFNIFLKISLEDLLLNYIDCKTRYLIRQWILEKFPHFADCVSIQIEQRIKWKIFITLLQQNNFINEKEFQKTLKFLKIYKTIFVHDTYLSPLQLQTLFSYTQITKSFSTDFFLIHLLQLSIQPEIDNQIIPKIIEKISIQQFIRLIDFIEMGSALFQTQENQMQQNLFFTSLCSIYSIYVTSTPQLNFIGQSFLFINKCSSLFQYKKQYISITDSIILIDFQLVLSKITEQFKQIQQHSCLFTVNILFLLIQKENIFLNKDSKSDTLFQSRFVSILHKSYKEIKKEWLSQIYYSISVDEIIDKAQTQKFLKQFLINSFLMDYFRWPIPKKFIPYTFGVDRLNLLEYISFSSYINVCLTLNAFPKWLKFYQTFYQSIYLVHQPPIMLRNINYLVLSLIVSFFTKINQNERSIPYVLLPDLEKEKTIILTDYDLIDKIEIGQDFLHNYIDEFLIDDKKDFIQCSEDQKQAINLFWAISYQKDKKDKQNNFQLIQFSQTSHNRNSIFELKDFIKIKKATAKDKNVLNQSRYLDPLILNDDMLKILMQKECFVDNYLNDEILLHFLEALILIIIDLIGKAIHNDQILEKNFQEEQQFLTLLELIARNISPQIGRSVWIASIEKGISYAKFTLPDQFSTVDKINHILLTPYDNLIKDRQAPKSFSFKLINCYNNLIKEEFNNDYFIIQENYESVNVQQIKPDYYTLRIVKKQLSHQFQTNLLKKFNSKIQQTYNTINRRKRFLIKAIKCKEIQFCQCRDFINCLLELSELENDLDKNQTLAQCQEVRKFTKKIKNWIIKWAPNEQKFALQNLWQKKKEEAF